MSLTVTHVDYDHASKSGNMVAILDEHLFTDCEKALTLATRYHLREVIALFTTIDPEVKVVDWYDWLAPLTCRYRRKRDGTWRVGGIVNCDFEDEPASERQENEK